jgi:hypothetical protein
LLSNRVNPDIKKHILDDEFGIATDIKIERELSHMCNLSAGVLEEGIELGTVKSLKSIMESLSCTFEKAASILNIPENEWDKYKSKL